MMINEKELLDTAVENLSKEYAEDLSLYLGNLSCFKELFCAVIGKAIKTVSEGKDDFTFQGELDYSLIQEVKEELFGQLDRVVSEEVTPQIFKKD